MGLSYGGPYDGDLGFVMEECIVDKGARKGGNEDPSKKLCIFNGVRMYDESRNAMDPITRYYAHDYDMACLYSKLRA